MSATHTKLTVTLETHGKYEQAKAATRIPMAQIAAVAIDEFNERRGIARPSETTGGEGNNAPLAKAS